VELWTLSRGVRGEFSVVETMRSGDRVGGGRVSQVQCAAPYGLRGVNVNFGGKRDKSHFELLHKHTTHTSTKREPGPSWTHTWTG